ncbi:MAG: DNA repair protein RadC [Bacteroidota bacterium]
MYTRTPIREWAIEDRPREKMMKKGIEALTNAELLAILLSSGTKEMSAIDLARFILKEFEGLPKLARAGIAELTQFKGIGTAKAIALVAAFELGRRKHLTPQHSVKVTSAETVANYLSPLIADLDQEVFYVLFLNRNNEIKAEKQFFKGGVASTIIDPKIVFREAINQLATAIILAHNHPSGNLRPSQADKDSTKKLIAAGNLFDIQVLDHIILSANGYFSFLDNDLMY